MIILPATTPAALVDQNSVNQAEQNQVEISQQSRKASDTVQFSPRALELAGNPVNESSSQQAAEVRRGGENDADSDEVRQAAAQQPAPQSGQAPASKIDVVA